MRVIIQEAAYDDLDRIWAWIARDPPRAADARRALWVMPGLPYILIDQVRADDELVIVAAILNRSQER